MADFGDTTPTNLNPMMNFILAQRGDLANQGAQQDLTDRATLRGLAPDLGSTDAATSGPAAATALTLGAPGVAASAGLSGMHLDQRAALDQTLGVTGQLSGAILNAPADQRAALWTQLRPQMIAAGATNTPVDYPGDDAVNGHRVASLAVKDQIAALGNAYTSDPTRTALSPPAGPRVGPQGAAGGAGGAGGSPGNFEQQIGAAEAPNASTVNPGGYSGQFQFGKGRLSDLGAYTPAAGESLAPGENAKPWGGTFSIPGFPDVRTHAEFLASPDAQRAVFASHVAGIDAAIAQTPGASTMDQNGLRAVAHRGGIAGMQKFVATNGAYDPSDSNGTSLSMSYRQFAHGGAPALQAALGHPDGPPAPAAVPGAPAGSPSGAVAGPPAVASADPNSTPGVQYASRGPMPGEPVTANDASPMPSPAAAAPGVTVAPAAAAGSPQNAVAAGPPAVAPAPAPQQNAALASGGQDTGQTGTASPAAAPGGSGQPLVAPSPVTRPLEPGEVPLYITGKGPAPAPVPGYQLTRRADGSNGMTPMPGLPPTIKSTAVGGWMINTDEKTGQFVSKFAIPDASRSTVVPVPGGSQIYQSGKPIGPVIPFSGRPEQDTAYKADVPKAEALTTAAQSAQASMPRLNEMADLVGQLSTGGLLSGARAKAAAVLEQLGVPSETIKSFTGMESGAAAQLFTKLAISTAGAAAKADVGANNGIQSTQLYQQANPGMQLLPDANKRVTNMMRVAAQQIQDYAQGALQHFGTNETAFLKGGDYAPLTTFNRGWLAQANPQIGAAAMGILNGDSFEKWSAKITPAQASAAAAMAARVDPTVQVPMRGGGMRPAADILAHPAIAGAPAPAAAGSAR